MPHNLAPPPGLQLLRRLLLSASPLVGLAHTGLLARESRLAPIKLLLCVPSLLCSLAPRIVELSHPPPYLGCLCLDRAHLFCEPPLIRRVTFTLSLDVVKLADDTTIAILCRKQLPVQLVQLGLMLGTATLCLIELALCLLRCFATSVQLR